MEPSSLSARAAILLSSPLSLALWPTARALTYMFVVVLVVVAAFHCLVALYKFTPPVLVAWKERRRISTH